MQFSVHAQRGKHNTYTTVSAPNTVVNTYTKMTANATAGATSIQVTSNTMPGGAFSNNLQAGDLILIIQMQGATIDIDATPSSDPSWASEYTVPNGYLWSFDWYNHAEKWGQVTNYNNAGKFEQVEVKSVSGGTTITLQCGLQNSYTASGNIQVVRVPRFQDLTINASSGIVPTTWNYAAGTGGVVAIEVNGNLTINNTATISASGYGFQGGLANNTGSTGSASASSPAGVGSSFLGSNNQAQGARKGEGIGGYTTEYSAQYSIYGRGSAANGGGGGGIQNSGGGGGANVGVGTYSGKGVPSTLHNAAWNLENAGFAGTTSPGGGRGGYSYSTSNQNATAVGPNNGAWSGDARKINGGLGGHALNYDATRLFMGGGGGAGDQDSQQGGAGGNGGGIVMVTCYGTISGNGTIESNGAVGQKTNPTNQPVNVSPTSAQKKGNDGAGGAGGGGSVFIRNATALPATLAINARGGVGGNVDLSYYFGATAHEGNGPGGGGGGGFIATTSGTAPLSVTGGASGVTNSNHLNEMNVNGATNGAAGITQTSTIYNIVPNNITVCQGQPITLTASVTGTSPGTLQWFTGPFTNPIVGTGNSYTPSPVPTVTTTYYVSVCPGTFRVPVTVTVNPSPIISGVAAITNAGCTTPGAISGLTASGGTGTLSFTWNGASSATTSLANASTGSYTLVATDINGCTATSGPHVIGGTAGPSINSSAVAITNQICNGTMGSITGLSATGNGLTYSWSPSGGSALSVTGLAQGSYTVTATDNVGCTASAGPFNVGFTPGPSVNTTAVVVTDETCSLNNGSIVGITATGTGLNYSWSNGGGAALNASNLNQGSYTLTVTDVNNCSATAGPFAVADQTGPSLNASGINIQHEICGQGNGSISGISATGGTGTLTYSWTNSAQTTIGLSSLSANNYTLTVQDINGCSATSGPHVVLNQGGPVFDNTNVVVTDVSCLGTLGSITGITVTGTAVQLLWNPGGQTSLDATNLAAGTYTLGAVDGNGCVATSGPYTVGTITGPSINQTAQVVTNETCSNDNGSITGITASGNMINASWSNGGGSSLDANSLSAGSYTLTVTDQIGCTASAGPIVIIDNAGPTIDAANVIITDEHCGQADGLIVGIDVNGGNAPVSYSWDNSPEVTLDLFDIAAGSYTLTATDNLGCTATAGPFVVNNIAGPTINTSLVQVTGISCTGTLGSISGITTTPATGLTVLWTNGGGSVLSATGLSAGSYSVTVEDAFGCVATAGPFVINPANDIVIDATNLVVTNSACTSNTGAIAGITFTGGTNPLISWSSSQNTLDIANLGPGNYILTVNDGFGCSDQVSVDVNTVNGPILDVTNLLINSSHCAQNDGSTTGITVSGGTPNYTYQWNGNAALNTINLSNVPAGNYSLTVTDAAGCTDVETLIITEVGGPIIDATGLVVLQPTCISTGQISGLVAVPQGNATVTYAWTNTTLTTIDLVDLFEGSYTLTVTDNFGCQSAYGPIVLTEPAGPVANFSYSPNPPNIGDVVTFNNLSTGQGLSYEWVIDTLSYPTTEDASQIFTVEGSYTISLEVTDQNGCIDAITQIIQVFDQIEVPNVITADNDGVNDFFVINGLKPNTRVEIYNRWGNTVLITDDYGNDWGGDDLNGAPLTEGVYTYKVIPVNDKPKSGFIHLIR